MKVCTCEGKPTQEALSAACRNADSAAVRLAAARLTGREGWFREQWLFEKTNPISRGALLCKELRLRQDRFLTDAVHGL